MSFEKPYEGLRVVDLSQGVAGPYCAMLLAQHGADVVKIEPLDGDWARSIGKRHGDHTAYTVPSNLGKRGIALDLKSDQGRAVVDRLLDGADVFLEGFRPGVIDRLGYGYERLSEANPGLIYVSISGFGQHGPLRDKPAMDPVLQAFSGFMDENRGPDGIPHRTPVVPIDMSSALYAQQAVAAALYARRDTGRGRRITISLLEAAANLQCIRLMSQIVDGPMRPGIAPSGVFPTAEGWIQVVVMRDRDFQNFCRDIDRPDLAEDDRFAKTLDRLKHADYLNRTVAETLLTRPATEWRELFTKSALQNEVVQTYGTFASHPHVEAMGAIAWLTQPGSETSWPTPNIPGTAPFQQDDPASVSPTRGQHTGVVLRDLGYSDADIAAMRDAGVIGGDLS